MVLHPCRIVRRRRDCKPLMPAAWTDFDQLVTDLSLWMENEPNHTKARLLMRALSYIYWQKNVIEECKGDNATLEAMLRAK